MSNAIFKFLFILVSRNFCTSFYKINNRMASTLDVSVARVFRLFWPYALCCLTYDASVKTIKLSIHGHVHVCKPRNAICECVNTSCRCVTFVHFLPMCCFTATMLPPLLGLWDSPREHSQWFTGTNHGCWPQSAGTLLGLVHGLSVH